MLITDRFVYVHMPKTGGTFVTEVLTRLHELPRRSRLPSIRRVIRALLRRVKPLPAYSSSRYGPIVNLEPKHGSCHDIPAAYRRKPILSNVRNPYDWYVSQYEFAWWKRTFSYHPEPNPTPVGSAIESALPEFQEEHPEFPDVSFGDFIELCHRASLKFDADAKCGLYTHGFLRYFFRDFEEIVPKLDRNYILSGGHRADMCNVDFLHTHRLNDDLYSYLSSRGYAHEDIGFIHDLGRILPMGRGRRDDQAWEHYYTPALKTFVHEREWALFEMFPEFDV